jgi:DNA-binding transcriptional MerR regulator
MPRLGGEAIRARKSRQPHLRPSGSASAENGAVERPLKIGEAARLVGVETYVLRFWETQFSCIRPRQSRSRHRSYTQGDVETLKMVKHLLHTEGYTIAGARKFIREKGLDGSSDSFSARSRARASRRTDEHLDAASAASERDPLTVKNSPAHRALREIREDLRVLHKLLAIR